MIIGKKIVMRPLELGDEKYLHEWRNDAEGNEYCGLPYGFLWSEEAYRINLQHYYENQQLFATEKKLFICKKDTMEPIGEITYRKWDQRNRSAEFGFAIGKVSERGHGYGADAMYHFITFMFNHLNLHKVELTTFADNHYAQRIYTRFGFKPIGLIRDKTFDSRTGKYMDILYMDLLEDEWRAIAEEVGKSLYNKDSSAT